MPLIETKGAASAQGFGGIGASSGPVNYIEDVFSTYLYTGNGSTQTITNGIDLSGKGGLVWNKPRTSNSPYDYHVLVDTVRGADYRLFSNLTNAQSFNSSINTFTSTGFTSSGVDTNTNGTSFVSWTFRKQPKFFDVVTYTGTTGVQTVSHNLGAVPGCIIMKATSTTSEWIVNHRSLPIGESMTLNTTDPASVGSSFIENATSTTFQAPSYVNQSGVTYVAYLFAHNAGGFGLSGTDNVISCGGFTTSSYYATVNLGYEPQWILYKRTDVSFPDSDWQIADNMRGLLSVANSTFQGLKPNLSSAEAAAGNIQITPTGFVFGGALASPYIYIAIRRGPMKVPTSGTSVFAPVTATQSGNTTISTGFPVDFVIANNRAGADHLAVDRLRGGPQILQTASTAAEVSSAGAAFDYQTSILWKQYANGVSGAFWNFRRAPSFFDEVCYTGTGVNPTNFNHNLGAVPELMIVKKRSGTDRWECYSAALGSTKRIDLNTDGAATTVSIWASTPTSTQFSLTDNPNVNQNGQTNVAYLFATCPGVSKVGSYTGTGTTQQINCGFTGGARFVLIKRTDSTGDWYVWDSARGIVAGNDPYLLLNSTAAEVTGTDYVDTYSAGFEISSTAPAGINANGGTFIFLAIA